VQVRAAPLPDDHVTTIDDIPVTTLARTVLDLCRTVPIEQAVAVGDRALTFGLVHKLLEFALAQMTRWPGIRQARRAVTLFDARSESPGESVSRVRLHEDGLAAPEPQQDIFDENGQFVARVDFCWKEQRTIGEFDGKIKYGKLRKPGQSLEDAIFAEKAPRGFAAGSRLADRPVDMGRPLSPRCHSRPGAAGLRTGLVLTTFRRG
jgi:hypothetical protein